MGGFLGLNELLTPGIRCKLPDINGFAWGEKKLYTYRLIGDYI